MEIILYELIKSILNSFSNILEKPRWIYFTVPNIAKAAIQRPILYS